MNPLQIQREKIDSIDRKIIKLLAERFKVTHEVGLIKASLKLPAVDKNREQIQFEKIERLANEFGIDTDLAQQILRLIIDKVVENHKKLSKNNK